MDESKWPLWALFDDAPLVLNVIRPASEHRDLPNKLGMHASFHFSLFGDLGSWLHKKAKFCLGFEGRWSASTWIKFPLAMEFTKPHSTKGNSEPLQAGQKPREWFCCALWAEVTVLSRQVEDKQPREHYRRPHLVQPRNDDLRGHPAEDANPKSCLLSSARRAGPHQQPH